MYDRIFYPDNSGFWQVRVPYEGQTNLLDRILPFPSISFSVHVCIHRCVGAGYSLQLLGPRHHKG